MANSTKISEYSTTAANNTSIDSIDIDENCPASGINNALRSVLKHQADAFTQGTPIALDQTNNRVGIGLVSPDSKLHVDSGVSETTDWANLGIISDFPINSNGRIYTSYLLQDSEQYKGAGIGLSYDGTGYKMHLATASSTSSGISTAMTIDRNGNVGIGQSSPQSNINSSTKVLHLKQDSINGSGVVMESSNCITEIITGNDASYFYNYTSDPMLFGTNNSETMRIGSGKVYIGRTSDPYMSTGSVKRLSVDGGTTSTDATFVSNKNSASTMYHFYFHNSNSVVGSISTNSYATSFNTSSDYRLKDNVSEMTGAIDRVKALAPKRFNWIDDADTTVDGFLAHEAQAVVPEAVTGTHNETQAATGIVKDSTGKVLAKDVQEADWSANEDGLYPAGSTWTASEDLPVYQTIDQSKLVPLLTGALQEAIAKIETLETEMTALKARVTALEA